MLIELTERVHRGVFGHAMSDEMRRFLHNLSWSALGGFVGSGLIFVVQAVAGRVLGPHEFGRASLALTVGNIAAIGVVLGLDLASGRTISRAKSSRTANAAITASALVVAVAILVWLLVAALLHGEIANLLSTTSGVVIAGLIYGCALGGRMLVERHTASLSHFRLQAYVRAIEGAGALIWFIVIAVFVKQDFGSLLAAMIIAATTSLLIYSVSLRHRFSTRAINRDTTRDLVIFARLAFVGYLPPLVFFYADNIALQRSLGAATLGIYTAYYLTTFGVTAQLSGIASNVLFPAVARVDDKRAVVAKLQRMLILGFLPLVAALVLVCWALLHVFGGTYDIAWQTITIFAVLAALSFFNALFVNVVNAHSAASFRREIQFQVARALAFAIVLVVLSVTGWISIDSVAGSIVGFEVIEYANLRLIIRTHVCRPVEQSVAGSDEAV